MRYSTLGVIGISRICVDLRAKFSLPVRLSVPQPRLGFLSILEDLDHDSRAGALFEHPGEHDLIDGGHDVRMQAREPAGASRLGHDRIDVAVRGQRRQPAQIDQRARVRLQEAVGHQHTAEGGALLVGRPLTGYRNAKKAR